MRNLTDRIDFILNRLLILFVFGMLVIYGSREIIDLDLWLHIKAGQVILQHHVVPQHDIFSYTLASKPWINHEWLFQVLTFLFYRDGGADGLILMQNIGLIGIFFLLLLAGLDLDRENHIFVFIVLYLVLLVTAYRFTIRPDLFSLFFLALYLFILGRNKREAGPGIWALPFCQVLWGNMHGFFFIGPLVILIFLIDALAAREPPQRLFLVFLLSVLAALINPYGLEGAAYPFSVVSQISGQGKIVFLHIQELAQPIKWKNILDANQFLYYKIFILLTLFSFRFNARHIRLADAILWVIFFVFSLMAIRNIAYFGIVGAYVIFNNVRLAMDHGKTLPWASWPRACRLWPRYAFVAFLFYYPATATLPYLRITAYDFDTYQVKSCMWTISPTRYPEKAVRFLLSHRFPERMLNDFNSGAYLIGTAYPQRRVFIDGRTELYGPSFFKDYVALCEGSPEVIKRFFNAYGITGCFISHPPTGTHEGLLRYIDRQPDWRAVYFDEFATIYLKKTLANRPLIDKFGFALKDWQPRPPDFEKLGIAARYPWPHARRARVLKLLHHEEAAAREARLILEMMPHNAEALGYMADYYYALGKYSEAFKFVRNGLIFSQGDIHMRILLALIYSGLNEDDKALKVINAVMTKVPKNAEAHYAKARIVKAKDPKAARELAAQACSLDPREPQYQAFLRSLK